MIFDEFYGTYYRTVAAILKLALERPVTMNDIREMCDRYSFGEAFMNISEKLTDGTWPLLEPVSDKYPKTWSAVVTAPPQTPLTLLEKRWLKAIAQDPRMKLFDVDLTFVKDVEPLFYPEDFIRYDCYSDGDNYADETYQANFRTLLSAIRERCSVTMTYESRRGKVNTDTVTPLRLEYSEKDDRFRVLCADGENVVIRNLAGVHECTKGAVYEGELPDPDERKTKTVLIEIRDHRNSMERVSLHFTHLRKEVERIEPGVYRMKLWYDDKDEPEMVVRVLQFGPTVRVIGPASFRAEVKKRVDWQVRLLADRITTAAENP